MIDPITVYHHERPYVWLAEHAASLGLPLVLLFTGIGTRICRACERIARGRWFWTAVLFAGTYVALAVLVALPIEYVALERRAAWGFSPLGFGPWSLQEARDAVRLILTGAALGWLPFWLIRTTPRWWWVWAGGFGAIVVIGLLEVRPLWIDPLSAEYQPLTDPEWRQRIDRLGLRAGLDRVQVLIQHLPSSNGCDNTTGTVEGIGFTRRLILGDDIFKHSTEPELTATIAHELKHYRFDATWKPVVMVIGFLGAGMLLAPLVSGAALRRWSARFGFSSLADPAALPLLVATARLFLVLAVPAFNLLSQDIEHEADRFALELTRDNEAVAHEVGDVCGPFIRVHTWFDRLYFDNHPSVDERVRFARAYRPWEDGQPLVYGPYLVPASQ